MDDVMLAWVLAFGFTLGVAFEFVWMEADRVARHRRSKR